VGFEVLKAVKMKIILVGYDAVKSDIQLLRNLLLLSSTLRMEIADSFCHSAERHIPEDMSLKSKMSSGPPVTVQ
jgi:hypothetical protein